MKQLTSILISYIMAAPLTSRISLDITQTEWTHIMTYVFWVFGGVIWALIVLAIVALVGIINEVMK